jgi:hypothetical protein
MNITTRTPSDGVPGARVTWNSTYVVEVGDIYLLQSKAYHRSVKHLRVSSLSCDAAYPSFENGSSESSNYPQGLWTCLILCILSLAHLSDSWMVN